MRARSFILALLAASCLPADRVSAQENAAEDRSSPGVGWTLHLDNDLFAFSEKDRDYTAGLAVTLGGERATQHPLFLGKALASVNRATGLDSLLERAGTEGDALEIGLLLFSPQDLSSEAPLFDD